MTPARPFGSPANERAPDTQTAYPRIPDLTVLVGADGSAEAAAALEAARLLERERGVRLHVLTVFEPVALPYEGIVPSIVPTDLGVEDGRRARLVAAVRRQVSDHLGEAAATGVLVERGRVVPTIVREAHRTGAGLLVLGLHPHDLISQMAGEETTLRVARTAGLPVLGVTKAPQHLPRRVIAAVDFSPAAVFAGECALRLSDEQAHVQLVHVGPALTQRRKGASLSSGRYDAGVGEALERLRAALRHPPGMQIECTILSGDPSERLLELARSSRADLIAIGSHRHAFAGRLVLGSVVTTLMRAAEVSLLVAPPTGIPPGWGLNRKDE
jgi:nucleotide-binding universal stress UspA family protein